MDYKGGMAYESLTQKTYALLRADLLACRILPGAWLRIGDLCHRYKASLSSVRETLSRLSAEGLVLSEPQRGFRVTPISASVLCDLTRVRIDIETICLTRSLQNGDLSWESDVVAVLHRLLRTPISIGEASDQANDAWADIHAIFHATLVSACGSPWLLQLREILYSQSERYRRLSLALEPHDRNIEAEHRGLVETALARDVPRLITQMTEHFQATTSILLRATPFLEDRNASPEPRRPRLRAASQVDAPAPTVSDVNPA